MATIRYSFRPSVFADERTVVIDDAGVLVQQGALPDRRVAWAEITDVHIEPATAGEDGRARFLINLRARDGWRFAIDSVDVRGAGDFEHKTEAFAAVFAAINARLADRKDVRFRYGVRRGVLAAWRIALVLVVAAGLFGMVAAIVAGEYEALFYALPFAAFGVTGLALLKGRTGPKPYDPKGMAGDGSAPA